MSLLLICIYMYIHLSLYIYIYIYIYICGFIHRLETSGRFEVETKSRIWYLRPALRNVAR